MALEALDRPMDKYLDYALWLTMRELEPEWMPALQQGKFNYGGNPRRLLFALQAAGTKDALRAAGETGPGRQGAAGDRKKAC